LLVLASLSSCAQSAPDRYAARSPSATFPTTTCLPALGKIADVVSHSSSSDGLIAAGPRPRAAVICNYRGSYGRAPSGRRVLAKEMALRPAVASAIASAAAQVSASTPPTGAVNCPADFGTVTVITFSYRSRPPLTLWWHTSGCQSIDNGELEASQLANPSFEHFQAVFGRNARTPG